MAIRKDSSIDQKIIELRKNKYGLNRILKWLVKWDNFSQLDEIVVLIHILNVLDRESIAVSRNEVKYTFNKYFNKKYHGEKRSYLNWIYKQCHIKNGVVTKTSRSFRKNTKKSVLERDMLQSNNTHKSFSGVKDGFKRSIKVQNDHCITKHQKDGLGVKE